MKIKLGDSVTCKERIVDTNNSNHMESLDETERSACDLIEHHKSVSIGSTCAMRIY